MVKSLINDRIIKSIENNEKARNVTHKDTVILIGLLEKLYTHLYGGIQKFKEEGVKDMIAEKLILETDRLIYESEKREENAKLEVAINLLNMGMTIEQIKNATNLPLNKIMELRKKK